MEFEATMADYVLSIATKPSWMMVVMKIMRVSWVIVMKMMMNEDAVDDDEY